MVETLVILISGILLLRESGVVGRVPAMLSVALASFSDLGANGLLALAAVTLFLLFAFWAGSLGSTSSQ